MSRSASTFLSTPPRAVPAACSWTLSESEQEIFEEAFQHWPLELALDAPEGAGDVDQLDIQKVINFLSGWILEQVGDEAEQQACSSVCTCGPPRSSRSAPRARLPPAPDPV